MEMKELTGKLTTARAEHKLATQILGSRIGELEADIQRVVGEHDAGLEREAEVRQKAEKAKESSKNKKKTLEKKLKGNLQLLLALVPNCVVNLHLFVCLLVVFIPTCFVSAEAELLTEQNAQSAHDGKRVFNDNRTSFKRYMIKLNLYCMRLNACARMLIETLCRG